MQYELKKKQVLRQLFHSYLCWVPPRHGDNFMSEWNAQSRAAADTLENYILNTRWEDFPPEVQQRAVTCSIDLFDVLISCSQTRMAHDGLQLAEDTFPSGSLPVIGSSSRLNLMGAVTSYAYNINALDVDDGHNMIKGHPGAVLMAGLWPAAMQVNASYKEFLTALVISYEVAIRAGLALHQYYGFYHGTGSWGAFGVAAGICRLFHVDRETLSNALGIADYQAPIAPIMRIVEIPSMNKDGIAWGAITGAMAVQSARHGITGQFYNLLEPQFGYLLDSLGQKYEIMNLYFKYFPCCRWAQAAVVAALNLRETHRLAVDEIEKVYIRTFKAGTQLSSVKPKLCDEAQYNMVYPVCAALAEGKFTPIQDSESYIRTHKDVVDMMDLVEFAVDEEMDAKFPRKRFAQVEVVKKTGEKLVSEVCEPWGEQEHSVGLEWVRRKFSDVSGHCFSEEAIDTLVKGLSDPDSSTQLQEFIEFINRNLSRL